MKFRVVLVVLLVLMLVALAVVPAMATNPLTVTGVYTFSNTVTAKYLDGSNHPNLPKGILTIGTQSGNAISNTTLTTMGVTVSLSGLVGYGSYPWISLTGTDGLGSFVFIDGRITKTGSVVSGITGQMVGYRTSDGEWIAEGSGGDSSAWSTAVAYGGSYYSTKLLAGTVEGSVAVQFKNPATGLKVSNLAQMPAGYGFMYYLQSGKSPGPQFELRFTAPYCTNPDGAGHVDVTVMPCQGVTGADTWLPIVLTSASTPCLYYGNKMDGDAFNWTVADGGTGVTTTLGAVKAAIEANTVLGAETTVNWKLTRVRIELWESGARYCYIDNIKVAYVTYTLEPVRFSGMVSGRWSVLQ